MLIEFLVHPKHNKGLTCSIPYHERHSPAATRQRRACLARTEGMEWTIRQMAMSHAVWKPKCSFLTSYLVHTIGMNVRLFAVCEWFIIHTKSWCSWAQCYNPGECIFNGLTWCRAITVFSVISNTLFIGLYKASISTSELSSAHVYHCYLIILIPASSLLTMEVINGSFKLWWNADWIPFLSAHQGPPFKINLLIHSSNRDFKIWIINLITNADDTGVKKKNVIAL